MACVNFCAADYVRLLLEHDADVNATVEDGNRATALMHLMQTSRFVTDEWRLECLDLLAGSQKLEIDRKDAAGRAFGTPTANVLMRNLTLEACSCFKHSHGGLHGGDPRLALC